jgi:hypothetical protein
MKHDLKYRYCTLGNCKFTPISYKFGTAHAVTGVTRGDPGFSQRNSTMQKEPFSKFTSTSSTILNYTINYILNLGWNPYSEHTKDR